MMQKVGGGMIGMGIVQVWLGLVYGPALMVVGVVAALLGLLLVLNERRAA